MSLFKVVIMFIPYKYAEDKFKIQNAKCKIKEVFVPQDKNRIRYLLTNCKNAM